MFTQFSISSSLQQICKIGEVFFFLEMEHILSPRPALFVDHEVSLFQASTYLHKN